LHGASFTPTSQVCAFTINGITFVPTSVEIRQIKGAHTHSTVISYAYLSSLRKERKLKMDKGKKVKLSLYLIKHHAMKTYGDMLKMDTHQNI
jgi:hypothetical protein